MSIKHRIKTGKAVKVNGKWEPELREVEITRGKAIKFFCYECMGFQKREVSRCTAPSCPLFPFRPGRHPEDEGRGDAKILSQEVS